MSHNRYYIIQDSADPKVNGKYPQIETIKEKHPAWPIYPRIDESGYLNPDVAFPYFLLKKKAKRTDWISATPLSSPFIMISDRLFTFFQSLDLYDFQKFDARVSVGDMDVEGYNIMNIIYSPVDYVDWSNSKAFRTQNFHKEVLQEYTFKSKEAYLDKFIDIRDKREYGFLPRLKIRSDISHDVFCFRLYGLPSQPVCTEEIKLRLLEEGYTGIGFEDVTGKYFSPEII